jgi:methyl-accepting chemotaxis protein
MEDSTQYKRKRLFIKKKFQLDFIGRIIALVILSGLCSGLIIYLLIFSELGAQLWVTHLQIRNAWPVFGPALITAYILAIGIACLAAAIIVLRTSNKIAGPLYRFEMVCKEIAKGNYDVSVKVRQSDQLRELSDAFGKMLDGLVTSRQAQQGLLEKAVAKTNELRELAKDSPEIEKLLDSLDQDLASLAAKAGWKAED